MICARCGCEEPGEQECPRCGLSRHPPPYDDGSPAPALDDSEYRQLTVMFCDLVGSTALSERLDAEDLRDLLREYQKRCATVIRNHRGYVAQFLGDGVMAYFGYPVADDQSAVAAVEAGLSLVSAVRGMQQDSPEAEKLEVRIGIHTGSVVVGDMGDPSLPQRLAVGATPNVAARTQSEAEADSVLITDATHRLVEGYFDCDLLGSRPMKGVSQPVRLFRVASRSAVSTRLQVSERRGLSRFVGRQRELATLVNRFATPEGEGRGAVILGEPGIGKSRLVHEFARLLGEHLLIDCSAAEHHESDALFPVLRYFARWAEREPSAGPSTLPERLAALGLGQAATELAALLPTGAVSATTIPTARHYQRTIEILGQFVRALASRQPAVLLVEDAHFLDPSTRYFLQTFSERRERGAFVLVTARPGTDLSWARAASLPIIELDRLDAESARAIATEVVARGAGPLPPEAVEQLLARSEGVPLFIEESARAHAEIAAVPPRVEPMSSEFPRAIPDTLRDSLAARLDRLGSARRVAQLASVIGRTFRTAWLSALLGSQEPAEELLAPLVEAGLVRKGGDAGGSSPRDHGAYEFSHALIRDAAYQSLMRGARARCHQRLVDVILQEHAEFAAREPLVMAHHSEAAGDPAGAAAHLLRAARRALTGAAFVEAMDIARRALDLLGKLRDPARSEPIEVELLTTLGLALISTRGYSSPEVDEVYTRAFQICERRGDAPLRVLYGLWSTAFVRGEASRLVGLNEQLSRALKEARTRDELLVLHASLGIHACFSGQLNAAREHLDLAIAALDREGAAAQRERLLGQHGYEGLLAARVFRTWVESIDGREASARRMMEETWALAEELGDVYTSCLVASNLAMFARDLGDANTVRFYAAKALPLSTEHGLYFWQAIAMCAQGWLLSQDGMPAEGLAMVESGVGIIDAVGAQANRGLYQACLADVLVANERLEDAVLSVDGGLSLPGLEPMIEPFLQRTKASILARLGRTGEAEALFRTATESARALGMRRLECEIAAEFGHLLAATGRGEEAAALLAPVIEGWPEGADAARAVAAGRLAAAGIRSVAGSQGNARELSR